MVDSELDVLLDEGERAWEVMFGPLGFREEHEPTTRHRDDDEQSTPTTRSKMKMMACCTHSEESEDGH